MKGTLACLIGIGLLAAADIGAQQKKGKYGKVLVAEFRIPSDTVAKYATHKPSKPRPGENKIDSVILADTEEWSGPFIDVKNAANPYTMVVTLTGTAKADGDALTMWHAGWRLDDREKHLTAFSGLSKLGAKAGERFTVTAAAKPTSFKEDRNVAVSLDLVSARNVDINTVDVELWSGVSNPSWLETLGAFSYLLVALILTGLVWFWRRRRQ